MKNTKLRELSPVLISVFILSLGIIGLASAAITNNGSIGGLFWKFPGDTGYDYNLQTVTTTGYKLDGRNVHTDFGGQNLTTTGSINVGAGAFTKKVTSSGTVAGDAANTLTTKGYVDNKLNNTILCPTGKYLESFNLFTNTKNCLTLPVGGTPYIPYTLTKYFKISGTFSWVVPAKVTSIKIIGVGGGGGGGSGWPGAGGGGGGGASASAGVFPVTQGQTITIYVGAKGAGSNGYNWCTIGYSGTNTSVTVAGVNYILGKAGQGGTGWTGPCGVIGAGGAKITGNSKITHTYSAGSNAVGAVGGKSSLNTLSYLGVPSSYFTYGKGGNNSKQAGNGGLVIIKY